MRPLCAAILLATFWILPCPSHAQDDAQQAPIAPTQAQLDLNARSVKAASEGDLDGAVTLLEASLKLGQLNITELNLGRTLQRAGRCAEADKAYQRALTAPVAAIERPTPTEIAELVQKWRAELRDTCPGTLRLTCPQADVRVSIDDGPSKACTTDDITLPQGKHTLTFEAWSWRRQDTIQVLPMETVTAAASVGATDAELRARRLHDKAQSARQAGRPEEARRLDTEAIASDPAFGAPRLALAQQADALGDIEGALVGYRAYLPMASKDERPQIEARIHTLESDRRRHQEAIAAARAEALKKERQRQWRGWLWTGGGAAALAGGLALDTLPQSADNFRFDPLDAAPLVLYAAGLGAAIYGIVTLLDDDPQPPTTPPQAP